MTITFYDCADDPRTMPKTLENGSPKTGSLRNAADVINPVILVTGDITNNYCYIPEFNRYYFINSTQKEITGLTSVYCHVDVLQSFYSDIISAPMTVERAGNQYNTYVPDHEREFFAYTLPQYLTIGAIGAPDTAIMVTVG